MVGQRAAAPMHYAAETKRQFLKGTRGGKIRRAFVAWYEQAPTPGTATAILTATPLADAATTAVLASSLHQPDVPRVVTIKGNAASVAGSVLVEGLDSNGVPISETIATNGSSAVTSTCAYARLTKITLPARGAAGNTISVGTGNVLGLWHALSADIRLATTFDGTTDAGTLATDDDEVAKNLFTPAGTLDGTKVLRIIYVVG